MRRTSRTFLVLSLIACFPLAACGDGGANQSEAAVAEAGPPPGPPARDSMSTSSLAGISSEEIALALPWASGRLNRGAEPGQSQRTIEDVLLLSGDGFDRFVVTFREDAPFFPGYRVEYVDAVADCAADPSESSFDTRGSAFLQFHLTAARSQRDDGTVGAPDRSLPAVSESLLGLHKTCDFEGQITWVFDLAAQTSFRLLELVNPTRLVIDVQHPAAPTEEPTSE